MERREASDIRSSSSGSSGSSGGAGEPSSSAASSSVAVVGDQTAAATAAEEEKHRCCICKNEFRTKKAMYGHMRTHPRSGRGVKPPPLAEQQRPDVRESAAAEQSIPARESVPVNQRAEEDEDANLRRCEFVVNQLLLLVEKSPQWLQGDDGGSSQNKITSDNSTAHGGGGNGEVTMKHGFDEPANISIVAAGAEAGAGAGVAVDAIIAAHNGTVSDVKRKGSSSSSSSAAGGSGAHTCEKCGRTFATGQSLGGHMRKHYDGPPININKKRAREQPEETPAPTAERRVREPAVPTAPLESHNPPALLSLSAQASPGGDCERNREEPERSSAGNGAHRPHELDLNELPEAEEELDLNELPEAEEEEPKNAPHSEPERRDDDGDDEGLLSWRLGQFDIGKSSSGV